MVISSRTPEGTPNRCPVCSQTVFIDPSPLCGDAPCPHCGVLLWFLSIRDTARFFALADSGPLRNRLLNLLAERWHLDPEALRTQSAEELGLDSLELVELVMELEAGDP